MRNLKKKVAVKTVSTRVTSDLYDEITKYTGENDLSISELSANALSFFLYCLENEDEDEDIKDVLNEYFGDADDDEDDDDYDDDDDDDDDDDN